MIFLRFISVAALSAALSASVWAQTSVSAAWVRATVAQQKATGAFMQITSVNGGKLVAVASSAAGVTELHEMKMDGDVMKMAAIASLELPAGKPVELRPGSYHVMLMDLKQPLKPGDSVPMTLTVQSADGKTQTVSVSAQVKAMAGAAPAPQHGDMKH